jgi:hypothetical protein
MDRRQGTKRYTIIDFYLNKIFLDPKNTHEMSNDTQGTMIEYIEREKCKYANFDLIKKLDTVMIPVRSGFFKILKFFQFSTKM